MPDGQTRHGKSFVTLVEMIIRNQLFYDKTPTLLVVDDQEINRELLCNLLDDESYKVFTANNGVEAVELYQQHFQDVVLMDLDMPKMDGYEASSIIKKIARENGRHVGIVIVSASDTDNCIEDVIKSGGDDFVQKPFNPHLLRAKIFSQLHISSLNDELKDHIDQLEKEIRERRLVQTELHQVSNYEGLTGLPNQRLFLLYLDQVIQSAEEDCSHVGLVVVQLSSLSGLPHSHEENAIVNEAAHRLKKLANDLDFIAHISSRSFAVILENYQHEAVAAFANSVISELGIAYKVDQRSFDLPVFAGVSRYPQDSQTPGVMLQYAELACNLAAQEMKREPVNFALDMFHEEQEKFALASALRQAIRNGEFELYYQPQVDSFTNVWIGCEALIRWNSKESGLVTPDLFVPLIESEGLIHEVGEWIISEVINQHVSWIKKGIPPVVISVNFSMLQLQLPGMGEKIVEMIAESEMLPAWFKLEITETESVGDTFSRVKSTLQHAREIGIQVAVDDFGTGNATLAYLRDFPVDEIKIDQRFIRDIPGSKDDMTLVKAVIGLAHDLRLEVVAEGVETKEQAEFLRDCHCDQLQGFMFGKPMTAADFEKNLIAQSKRNNHNAVEIF